MSASRRVFASTAAALQPSRSRPALEAATVAAWAQQCLGRRTATRHYAVSAKVPIEDPYANKKILFNPVTTPELQAVLDRILKFVILPSYLTEQQQRKVFLKKGHADLAQNPVVLEIEGLTYKFPPVDRIGGGMPRSRVLFWEALKNMRTGQDWAALPNLLAGYRRHMGRWRLLDQARIIQMAGAAGHLHPVIQCMTQKRTGMVIDTSEKLSLALCFVGKRIVDGSFGAGVVRRAALWTDDILDLTRRPFRKDNESRGFYLCRRSYMAPMAMFPAVTMLLRHGQPKYRPAVQKVRGQKVKIKSGLAELWPRRCDAVTKQVEAMLAKWPAGKGLLDICPPDRGTEPNGIGPWYLHKQPWHLIMVLILSILSMRTAGQLLRITPTRRPDLADQLSQTVKTLEVELAAELAKDGPGRWTGVNFYNTAKPHLLEAQP